MISVFFTFHYDLPILPVYLFQNIRERFFFDIQFRQGECPGKGMFAEGYDSVIQCIADEIKYNEQKLTRISMHIYHEIAGIESCVIAVKIFSIR